MATTERRKRGRIALTHQPRGSLTLRVAEQYIPVLSVTDISATGVNLVVTSAVAEQTPVMVEYADAGLRFDVYGMVIWQAQASPGPAGEPAATLGIELFSPTLLTAFLGAPDTMARP